VIAAFIAQGYNPEISALLAVYVHGVAGDIAAEEHGQYGVTAGDIADNIGKAIAKTMK
jgi:NAD(P)H-hydrate epimerase